MNNSTHPIALMSSFVCRRSGHFETCYAFFLFLPYSGLSLVEIFIFFVTYVVTVKQYTIYLTILQNS